MARPTCFFSYTRESVSHQDWVLGLARDLSANGVAVSIDHELRLGSDLTRYMEQSIRESDYVVIVCTPNYARRANKRLRGVGYETTIITGEMFNTAPEHKFIPVLRKGDFRRSLPTYLSSRLALDFSVDGDYEESLTRLVRHLWNEPLIDPVVVGDRPQFGSSFRARRSSRKKSGSSRKKSGQRRADSTSPVMPATGPRDDGAPEDVHARFDGQESRGASNRLRWARQTFRSRLNSHTTIFGPDHRVTLAVRYDWAKRIGSAGDPAEAAKLYKTLAADFKRVHGPRHRGHLASKRQQAYWSNKAGDQETAIRLYADLLRYYTKLLGPDHRYSRLCQAALIDASAAASQSTAA